jgi:ATP-dependent Lon protease
MRAVDDPDPDRVSGSRLLPVLPLDELCLFPGASLAMVLDNPASVTAALLAARCGGQLLALARREGGTSPKDLHSVGTIAAVREIQSLSPLEHRAELDGISRARVDMLVGTEVLVAEVVCLEEGDEADEWGPAVEALARYLHAHADLRAFLEQQRRSTEGMSWVNLACQHLPITSSARQKLLESSAPERCLRISRGLDALLRKEQGS